MPKKKVLIVPFSTRIPVSWHARAKRLVDENHFPSVNHILVSGAIQKILTAEKQIGISEKKV